MAEHGTHIADHATQAGIDFISGLLGGAANTLSGQPLDTIKTKLQTYSEKYNGTFHCFSSTLKKGGVRALYTGAVPTLISSVNENAVLFCAYGTCQKVSCMLYGVNSIDRLTAMQNATAGSMAAFLASFTNCPTEMIKNRMQTRLEAYYSKLDVKTQQATELNNNNNNKGSARAARILTRPSMTLVYREVVKQLGYRGLYRGWGQTATRDVVGYYFFFGAFHLSQSILLNMNGENLLKTALSGGLGGVCLWAVIYPVDAIKSRVQVRDEAGKPGETMLTLYRVIRAGQLRTLYNGLIPTLFRTFLASASLFTAYTLSRRFMQDEWKKIKQGRL